MTLYSSACGVLSFLFVYHAYVTESRRGVEKECYSTQTVGRCFLKIIFGDYTYGGRNDVLGKELLRDEDG
jgi:hypothetical protein